jgi:hypothetical protein
MDNTDTLIIYVLELENGKYYVGKSRNPDFRFLQHMGSIDGGSEWTKIHPPISIIEKIHNASHYDENKYTLIYMEMYGIDNVRGGTYCQINLTDHDRNEIIKQLRSAQDLCFRCGGKHFIQNCPMSAKPKSKYCKRCSRNTHTENKCYAKKHIKGTPLVVLCNRCGRNNHTEENVMHMLIKMGNFLTLTTNLCYQKILIVLHQNKQNFYHL